MADDKPYTKREMDLKIDDIHKDVKYVRGDVGELKEMIRFTNGKVKKLILAVVAISGVLIGAGFNELKPFLTLFI